MANINTQKQAGFTLIELIAMLLLMGIIVAVIVNRWALSDTEQIGQIAVIKSHLRYAQSKAMSSSTNWYVHFETAPAQYTLYKQGDGSKYFPGETEYNIALESGLSLSAETYVLFDYLGRPYTDLAGTYQSTVRTIITSSAGNVEIKPETGFIP